MMNEPTSSTLPRPGLRTPANEQRSPFRATLVAWLVWTISLLTATAALVLRVPLYAWASFTQDASSFATALYWLVLVPAAVPMYATVGAVIAARRPGHWVGWLCLLLAWSIALEDLCWQYAGRAAATTASVPTSGVVAALASSVVAGMTPLFLILLLLRLPTGTFLSPRWRMVSWGAVSAFLLHTLATLLRPELATATAISIPNPTGVAALAAVIGGFSTIGSGGMAAGILLGLGSLVLRWRRGAAEERLQLTWLTYVGTIILVAGLSAVLGILIVHRMSYVSAWLGGIAIGGATIGIPIAIGIAVLRYRLYDIDVLINRTLVYGVLTTIVGALYVVMVGYLSTVFQARGNLLVSLVATGVVAVLFQPLRARVQRGVNHLLYGERDEPYVVLSRLGQRLETTLAPDAVLPTMVDTVREALKLPYVAIEVMADTDGALAAEHDRVRVESARPQFDVQHERLVRIPLTYQHATVGALLLAPRRGDAFSPADRRLLHDLARQAGVAVHAVRLHAYAVQLSTDLQQSRERMVTAREEERRRLRRDLHDGLGPTLAGLTLKVDAALDELAYDTASTAALLHELKGDIQTAITDIRRLVYALRPPALDELSLVGALRVQLASFEHAGLQIVLEALGDLRTLPAAVEVAAYRIVLEAVTNVARHAHAAHAWIHLSRTETHVIIDIQDDGRGVSHNLVPGVGLQSMRERAAELGGTCAITSRSAGGIHVVARLPTHKE